MPDEDPQAKSPAARLLGREVVERDSKSRTAKLRFRASPDFLNRRGTIQGGILAAMLDSVFGSDPGRRRCSTARRSSRWR